MTLAEAGEIFAYWAENPPAHLMLQVVARAFGWNSVTSPGPVSVPAGPPPGVAVVAAMETGFPPALLDLEALRQRNRERAIVAARKTRPVLRPAVPRS